MNIAAQGEGKHVLYECGICSHMHAWDWNGDCREDGCRFGAVEDYMALHGISAWEVVVLSWEERCEADLA